MQRTPPLQNKSSVPRPAASHRTDLKCDCADSHPATILQVMLTERGVHPVEVDVPSSVGHRAETLTARLSQSQVKTGANSTELQGFVFEFHQSSLLCELDLETDAVELQLSSRAASDSNCALY